MDQHIKGKLLAEQQQAVFQAIAEIQKQLPILIDLTTEDRRNLPKMGDKSRSFVDQGLVLATQNEDILPRNFDLDQYRCSVTFVRQMEGILMKMRQLTKRVEDTYMAAGSDAFTQTLVVYHSAKLSGKGGGLDEHLDSLGRRFVKKHQTPSKTAFIQSEAAQIPTMQALKPNAELV